MQGRANGWLVPWLLVAAAGQVVALEVVRRAFVHTTRGQLLDTAALAGNSIGRRHIDGLVDTVLSAMTVLSLAAAIVTIGFIALIRGRLLLAAVATLLVVGANLTTQLVKTVTARPDLGIDVARVAAGNSLPSGHATVAASVAVALVLVLPPRVRGWAGVLGAGYAALAGVATLSAGWHRPSDAVAAFLVVGAWAAAAGLLLVLGDRRPAGRPAAHRPPGTGGRPAPPHRHALAVLALAGSALLAGAAAAMVVTDRALATPVELFSHGRLFTAYAGGAAGIAGVAGLMMALVLATAHLTGPGGPRVPAAQRESPGSRRALRR